MRIAKRSLTNLVLFSLSVILPISGQANTQIYVSNGDMFMQQIQRNIPGSARQWVTSVNGSVRLVVDPITQKSTYWYIPLTSPPVAILSDGDSRLGSGETLGGHLRLRPDGLYFTTDSAEVDAYTNPPSFAHSYKYDLAAGTLTQFPITFKNPIVVKRLDGSIMTGKPWFSSTILPSKDGTQLLELVGLVDPSKTSPTILDVQHQSLIRVDTTPYQEVNLIANSFIIGAHAATIDWQYDFSTDTKGGVNFLAADNGQGPLSCIMHFYADGTSMYLISNGGYTNGELVSTWTEYYQDPWDPITADFIVTYNAPGGFGRVTRMIGDQVVMLAKGEDYSPQIMGFGFPSYNAPYMYLGLGLGSVSESGVLNTQGRLSTFNLARKLPDGSSSAWIGQIAAPNGCGTEFYQSGLDSVPTAEWRAFKPCISQASLMVTVGQLAVIAGHNLVSEDPTLLTTLVDLSEGETIGPCTGTTDAQVSCAIPSYAGSYQVAVRVGSQVQSDPFTITVNGPPAPVIKKPRAPKPR